jgi:hypothetical protein
MCNLGETDQLINSHLTTTNKFGSVLTSTEDPYYKFLLCPTPTIFQEWAALQPEHSLLLKVWPPT